MSTTTGRSAVLDRIGHLTRRFVGSLSRQPPAASDEVWAASFLRGPEQRLWSAMSSSDRRHAIEVARRFEALRPAATRAEVAAALLHDVGKLDSGLGTFVRVAATVFGPRGQRFRAYHDHERCGADRLEVAGSDPVTVALVRGHGPGACALRAADDV